MTSKKQSLALVENQEKAYNNKDLESFCNCFHDQIEILRLTTNEGYKGKEVFKNKYKELFSNNPDLHCEIKTRIILESTIVDEEWITGIANNPSGLHAVAIYGFKDNKIDRVWFTR